MLVLTDQTGKKPFSPLLLPGVQAGYTSASLDALADGAAIATWSDATSYGRSATQGSATLKPTKQTITNGGKTFSVARFDATNDTLATAAFSAALTQPITIVAVVAPAALRNLGAGQKITDGIAADSRCILHVNADNRWALYAGTDLGIIAANTNWNIVVGQLATTDSWIRVNGVWQTLVGNAGSQTLTGLTIGNRYTGNSGPFGGDIAELWLFDPALSIANIKRMESYLATLFGITLPSAASSMANCGGNWIQRPRAVQYNGRTTFGYVGTNGDILVNAYSGSSLVGPNVTLRAVMEDDDHDNPSFLVQASDNRLQCYYSKHSGILYKRLAVEVDNIDCWGPEQTIANEGDTYPQPIQLTGEANSPIYLFTRDLLDGTNFAWYYRKSTDEGATWAAKQALWNNGNAQNYLMAAQNGTGRIDFAATDIYPNNGATSVYHFYYSGSKFYQSDGTEIVAALPLAPANATLVYDGSSTRGWIWDIAISDGKPIILMTEYPAADNHDYYYARWTGAAWLVQKICDAGGSIFPVTEDYYSGGFCLDHANPNVVYASIVVSGQWEIYKYVTADGGATWTSTAITSGSSVKQIRPHVPYNASGTNVIWLSGTYDGWQDGAYDLTAMRA